MKRLKAAVADGGFLILPVSVAIAALPLGSVDAASAGFIGLLVSLSLFHSLSEPPPNRWALRITIVSLFLCAGLIALSIAQVIPLPLGPGSDPFWIASAEITGDTAAPLAAARYQALTSIGYVILPIAVFISALLNVRDTSTFTRMADVVLGISAIATVASLLQYFLSPDQLLLEQKVHYLDSFTGTFTNPNTAATYFGILTLLSLALMSRPWGIIRPLTFFTTNRRWGPEDNKQAMAIAFYAVLALLFGLALFLTRSRAGVLSSLLALAVLAGGQTFVSLRRKYTTRAALGGTALAIVSVCALFALFGSRLLLRIETEGFVDEQRLCTYASTWQAIKEHLAWGAGAGTFQDVFPSYRAEKCGIDGYWEMAHSVPLEGWLAFGGAFLVAAAIAYVTLIATYAKGLRERRRYRYVPLVCLSILLLVTVHSLVDFSLQIPAVALLVAWSLGGGAAVSVGRSADAPTVDPSN